MMNDEKTNLVHFSNRERVNACIKKIEKQFPTSPEALLMLAVVQQAIKDCFGPPCYDKHTASAYLRRPIIEHAELCGVDSEWIRAQIKYAGLNLGAESFLHSA